MIWIFFMAHILASGGDGDNGLDLPWNFRPAATGTDHTHAVPGSTLRAFCFGQEFYRASGG
jgi:hypothetical protein